ncbi:MAG: hypothetical protein ACLFM8_03530 [Halobacteriales archaeon]
MDRVRALGALAAAVVAAFVLGSLVGFGWSIAERPAVAVGTVLVAAFVLVGTSLGTGATRRLENPYW